MFRQHIIADTQRTVKRAEEHNAGKGAKYTRQRRPAKLIFAKEETTLSAALKEENLIKKKGQERKGATYCEISKKS